MNILSTFFLLNLLFSIQSFASSYKDLIPYIVPSPNQAHTDNCLYMAATGAMEILINKHFEIEEPGINGKYDFNELIALKGDLKESRSWFENPVLRFNQGALRNRDQAYKGSRFWNGTYREKDLVAIPQVETFWLLKTDGGSKEGRFSYDEFTHKSLDKIKNALTEYESPLLLIYRTAGKDRSYGYWNTWHTVVIVGFDDEMLLDEKCPLTEETATHIGDKGKRLLLKAIEREGGCSKKGAFIVRDSENPQAGHTRIRPFIYLSYDDVRFLGTNVLQVRIKKD
jgi:hypothetical protein